MSRVVAVCGLCCLLVACTEARTSSSTSASTPPTNPAAAESGGNSAAASATLPSAAVMASPQMQSLTRKMSRQSTDLREEQLPSGVRKVDLQGRFHHATVLAHPTDSDAQRRVCIDRASQMAELF